MRTLRCVAVVSVCAAVHFLSRANALPLLSDSTKAQSFTEVGTGWSVNENPGDAVKEACAMALKDKHWKKPDFAVVFATSGSDLPKIFTQSKDVLGNKTKLFGGTSDSRTVITNKGVVKVTDRRYEYASMEGRRGLSVMTVSSDEITFGVGSSEFSAGSSIVNNAKAAVLSAIAGAHKTADQKPAAILLCATNQVEEECINGIESVLGKNIPIIGGTVGGWKFGVMGEKKVYEKGISLAVVYTNLPSGWTYEGGFDVKDPHSGIVTKTSDNFTIAQIDYKPALDVYNKWLGNDVYRMFSKIKKPDIVSNLMTLHPLYRKYTAANGQNYYLFQYLWINEETLKNKAILTSAKVTTGERLYLSHGTWETLLNRIGNMPKNVRANGNVGQELKPLFGYGDICAAILGTIPEEDRVKISPLINYANDHAPFIMNCTWGEQGLFPGIGNKHGNLFTSFFVIYK